MSQDLMSHPYDIVTQTIVRNAVESVRRCPQCKGRAFMPSATHSVVVCTFCKGDGLDPHRPCRHGTASYARPCERCRKEPPL